MASVNAIRVFVFPDPEVERRAIRVARTHGLVVKRVSWVAIVSAHARKPSLNPGQCVHTTVIHMEGEQPCIETLHTRTHNN